MAHSLQVSAVCMAILAVVLLIVALTTKAWMEGCANAQEASGFERALPVNGSDLHISTEQVTRSTICLYRGLSYSDYTFGNDLKMTLSSPDDHYAGSTSGLLIASLVLSLIAAALIFKRAFCAAGASRPWSTAAQVGVLFLVVADVLLVAGMAVYTSSTRSDYYELNSEDRHHNDLQQYLKLYYNGTLKSSFAETKNNSSLIRIPAITTNFSISYGLSWASLLLLVLATLFMLCSFKQKTSATPNPPPGKEYGVVI